MASNTTKLGLWHLYRFFHITDEYSWKNQWTSLLTPKLEAIKFVHGKMTSTYRKDVNTEHLPLPLPVINLLIKIMIARGRPFQAALIKL
jgi:hypothetical protein